MAANFANYNMNAKLSKLDSLYSWPGLTPYLFSYPTKNHQYDFSILNFYIGLNELSLKGLQILYLVMNHFKFIQIAIDKI